MSATYLKPTDSDEDPVTLMLQKTGCLEKHYKVQVRMIFFAQNTSSKLSFSLISLQECIAETQDWRQCQNIVKDFKDCMQEYTEKQRQKYSTK
jgi:hypothetical protein